MAAPHQRMKGLLKVFMLPYQRWRLVVVFLFHRLLLSRMPRQLGLHRSERVTCYELDPGELTCQTLSENEFDRGTPSESVFAELSFVKRNSESGGNSIGFKLKKPDLGPVALSANENGSAILRFVQSNDSNSLKKNVKLSVRLTESRTRFDDRSLPKKRGRSYWRRVYIGMPSDERNERETSDKKSSRGYGLGSMCTSTVTLFFPMKILVRPR
ncbi:hypothetical protein PI124_g10457 [Phytophthora idaei]|nr:hypothetical protein PI125_g19367 [Phytophthora idaei]KAG3155427.1 hypothetical protein PI126_g9163 [Phytophthora idaei]KAG3244787.1 hypothetical protein PI124_g10457 [Phytophthora idaei]